MATSPTDDEASGIVIRDAKGGTVASSDDCSGTHGEAAAADGALVFGCEDGLLLVKGDRITKVDSPDAYGRVGNQAGGWARPSSSGTTRPIPTQSSSVRSA